MKVGMVSKHPPSKSKHARVGGVATYTKNLVVSLLNNCEVAVFADRISHTNNEYHEDAIVYRCWNESAMYPFQVFKRLLNKEIDVVHVQHEIYLYGGLGSAILFPLLLFLIRVLRKPAVVTLHGVIPLSKVDGRFLRENWTGRSPLIMRGGLILLVRTIAFLSTSIIVHEEKFKEVLGSEYNCPVHKVWVIHHGIEERNDLVERNQAKQILGLEGKNVILFFGYITGYKNIELLIESTNFLKTPDWVIVIAGGSHPRLSGDPSYRRYLSGLRDKALAIFKDRILFRGFIDEEEVPLYFSAADLMVFPYKADISSSGPMCLAVSYKTPFLISNSFKHVVRIEELVFKADPQELADKIETFFQSPDLRSRALKRIEQLGVERSWGSVAKATIQLYESIIK
jgi:glycosyltransferase involved in cell wall biosynthesis